MADFTKIYPTLIKWEGFYANDKNDPGGETYMGIARKFNPTWPGWAIIDQYKREHGGTIPTNTEIKDPKLYQLVYDRAYQYFQNIYGNQIKSDAIATIAIQLYWGTAAGIKNVIQQAAKNLGANIAADNVFGMETLAAINKLPEKPLYEEIKRLYVDYFTRLGKNQPQYAAGWMNRVKYVINKADSFIKSTPGIVTITLIAGVTLFLIAKK